jgi:hypothetical protein
VPVLVIAALAVVAEALAAFAVHSAFDFMWHVPVVPIVVAALVGAALAPGRGSR